MSLLVLLLLLACPVASAQADRSPDWYYQQAREAMAAENYETAVDIIEQGKERFPEAADLRVLLADLYYDKELYGPALQEYLGAAELQGEEYLTLVQISRCYGKLNQEQQSIAALKRVLESYPDSVSSIDDLGWMYFKTHQLEKGEELLLEALDRLGPDRGIYMTLGTLYSGMYDYENSKRFYLLAIKDALEGDDLYFASVAYYNLSLLEESFYNYNSALRYTDESIQTSDRAPGHLARGELFLSRLDFGGALAEYQAAIVKDRTPLAKVNLASLYQKFGKLGLARSYAEEVLSSQDLAWMYYYGTDLQRHLKDVHEILADVYSGLARRQRAYPLSSLWELPGRLIRGAGYRLLAYYHRQKRRSYNLRVGRAYLKEKNLLDAYWEFYKANERYRPVALKYLSLARDLEEQISPHAGLYYEQEEGRIRGDAELLERSIQGLDPYWEREDIFDGLRYQVAVLGTDGARGRQGLNRLYELNRGGLLQYGLALPLAVRLEQGSDRVLKRCVRFLRRSGSPIAPHVDAAGGFRYRLVLDRETSDRVSFSLHERDRTVFSDSLILEKGSVRRRAAALARRIIERIYSMER